MMVSKGRPARGAFLLGFLVLAVAAVLATFSVLAWPGRHDSDLTGTLVIYSSTDEDQFAALLSEFHKQHPGLALVYRSLPAREVYQRTRDESDQGKTQADVVISSAMDLQIKLVNDRYAQSYSSPHRNRLPSWAVWKNEAFAVTSEPIVIGYNKQLMRADAVPNSHDELAAQLNAEPAKFESRIGLYDPEQSPTGYMYIRQDLHIDKDNWDLIGGIGRASPRLFTSTKDMIDRVSAGDLVLAYNIIGSYALQRARTDPNFGVIIPRDYVLISSRVALIPRKAPNPEAARRFLDFMLSRHGQKLLSQNDMIPLHKDVAQAGANNILNRTNKRAIHVGPALMADLDSVNQTRFFTKWNSSIGTSGGKPVAK